MDEERMRELSLPLEIKPFRVRTREAWAAFLAGEGELRTLMEQKDRAAVSEQLVARCSELLSPAFANPAFELGFNGKKYELILSPEGDRTRMFQLAYFQKRAPEELLDRWNILVGRTRSARFVLKMFGQEIALSDVQVWVEKLEGGGVELRLYCEKLLPVLREDENKAYNMIYILLDQALGELAAMRYVDGLELLAESKPDGFIPLNWLAGYLASEVDPEGWEQASNPELASQRYTAYQGDPVDGGDWTPRQDVYAGITCCTPLIRCYFQGEDSLVDQLHRDGVVAGFFYYPLDGVDKKAVLDLRDQLEETIEAKAGEDAVLFTGGATGVDNGYLDFIAWDLKAVLDAAAEAFAAAPVAWAGFHTFRLSARGVALKRSEKS